MMTVEDIQDEIYRQIKVYVPIETIKNNLGSKIAIDVYIIYLYPNDLQIVSTRTRVSDFFRFVFGDIKITDETIDKIITTTNKLPPFWRRYIRRYLSEEIHEAYKKIHTKLTYDEFYITQEKLSLLKMIINRTKYL